MPNHIQNEIVFEDEAGFREVLALVLKEEMVDNHPAPHVEFNTLIQMPEHNENFWAEGDVGKEQEKIWNWYNWSISNWGTKWGAYSTKVIEERKTLRFQTAWAAPMPILFAIAARFPGVDWRWKYADEDYGRNLGIIDHVGGQVFVRDIGIEVTGESQPEFAEPLVKWACELHGHNYREWKEEQEA